jgi:hypothetical protein
VSQLNKNGFVPSNPSPTKGLSLVGITKLYTNKSTPMWGFCQTQFKFPSNTVNSCKREAVPKDAAGLLLPY